MSDKRIGLTPEESARFSIAKWARAAVDPKWGAKEAGFELGVADNLRQAYNASEGSLPLSPEIMARTLTATGGAAAGGALVQTTVSPTEWAPALRAASRVVQLGATVVQSSENLSILSQTPASAAAAVSENASKADSDTTFVATTYSPSTIKNNMTVSRRLLNQTALAETIVRDDLDNAIAEMVDFYAIQGSGSSGQPTGLLNTAGISTVALGANGAAPTYASLIDMIRQVALKKNLLAAKAGFLASTKAAMTLRNVTKTASWGFLWDDAQSYQIDGWVLGYRAMMSENVPSNLTKGSGTNLSAMIFGNWSDLYIVEFSPPTVIADPYTYSSTGAVRFNITQEVDIKPRRVDAFSMIKDMIAS